MKRRSLTTDFSDTQQEDPMRLVPMDLRHLVPGFIERREKDVLELLELLASRDYPAIRDIGHKLKGTGGGYGFQRISDIGREMETAAVTQDMQTIRNAIDELSFIAANLKGILILEEKN